MTLKISAFKGLVEGKVDIGACKIKLISQLSFCKNFYCRYLVGCSQVNYILNKVCMVEAVNRLRRTFFRIQWEANAFHTM